MTTRPPPMADVVERLRKLKVWDDHPSNGSLGEDAATEIETLRARLSQAGAGGGVVTAAVLRDIVSDWESNREYWNMSPDAKANFFERHAAALSASPSPAQPVAWRLVDEDGEHWWGPSASKEEAEDAHAKAPDLILQPLYATPPAPSVQPTASVEAILREAWSFLQDRLLEFEQEIGSGEEEREWAGHVMPALSRFGSIIASLTPAPAQGDGAAHHRDIDYGYQWAREAATPSPAPVSAPSPAGGEITLNEEAASVAGDGFSKIVAQQELSSPATPKPVSAPAGEVVKAVARAMFDRRHPFESWSSFDERFEARGNKLHPMQEEAIEDAKTAIATLATLSNTPGHGEAVPVAWRDMDSAPKDGTHVLLAEQDGSVSESRWLDDDGEWWRLNNDQSDHWGEAVMPVAWQPLPFYAHPATGDKEGRS